MRNYKRVRTPVIGAFAVHISGNLDDRAVVAISDDGDLIQINIMGEHSSWLLTKNYNFFVLVDPEAERLRRLHKQQARALQQEQPGLKYTAALRMIKEQESVSEPSERATSD